MDLVLFRGHRLYIQFLNLLSSLCSLFYVYRQLEEIWKKDLQNFRRKTKFSAQGAELAGSPSLCFLRSTYWPASQASLSSSLRCGSRGTFLPRPFFTKARQAPQGHSPCPSLLCNRTVLYLSYLTIGDDSFQRRIRLPGYPVKDEEKNLPLRGRMSLHSIRVLCLRRLL